MKSSYSSMRDPFCMDAIDRPASSCHQQGHYDANDQKVIRELFPLCCSNQFMKTPCCRSTMTMAAPSMITVEPAAVNLVRNPASRAPLRRGSGAIEQDSSS